jgi:Uncharacterized protein conserved in bacteria (DUF2188)
MADLKVVRNELDGWDVVRADENVALTNLPTREAAEEAARQRAQEESISEEGPGDVIVDTEHTHGIDDAERGMKTAFLSIGGLLAAIAVLAIVIALIVSLTNFGG